MERKGPVPHERGPARNDAGPAHHARQHHAKHPAVVPVPRDPGEIQGLVHELQVHQIELEMQNEELQKTREEVKAGLDRYVELYDFAPVGYFTLDNLGLILQANFAGASMLGSERSRLTGRPFVSCIAPGSLPAFTALVRNVYRQPDAGCQTAELTLATSPPVILRIEARVVSPGARCLLAATDITGYREAEEKVRIVLQEKEILLREIHHRVKNNLQIVSGLLDMSRMRITDPATVAALTDMMLKIQSMAQIHTSLYERKESNGFIDLGDHIRDQIRTVSRVYENENRDLTFQFDLGSVRLPIDQAIPCALVINEILTNIYKHAYKDRRRGLVRISTGTDGEKIRIAVRDDGIGFPAGFDIENPGTLGMKLMKNLVIVQLRGTFSITGSNGTEVVIEFPAGPGNPAGRL